MNGQRYTPEFKEAAIKQVLERCYTTADVAERLGVAQHSIYKWVKRGKLLSPFCPSVSWKLTTFIKRSLID